MDLTHHAYKLYCDSNSAAQLSSDKLVHLNNRNNKNLFNSTCSNVIYLFLPFSILFFTRIDLKIC